MLDQYVGNPDLSLSDLAKRERMSVRAYNICNTAGLHSLNTILDFYANKGTFAKLRNAGRLTEEELVGICHKYTEIIEEPDPLPMPEIVEPPSAKLSDLTAEQLAIVERHFQLRLDSLKARSLNVLKNIVPRIDTDAVTYESFFADPEHQKFNSFLNAGRVTINELLELRAEILQLAHDVANGLTETSIFAQNVALWKRRFGLSDEVVQKYRKDFFVRRFPLFRFLQDLFDKKLGLGERDLLLMQYRYNYYLGSSKVPFEEIAGQLNVTRERVRQLTVTVPSRIHDLVATIGLVYDFVNYEALYSRSRDLIVVDEEFAECINAREGVSFVSLFYATVFAAFLNETHDRVEEDFDEATEYLIRRELTTVFDFDAYLRDLADRTGSRIPETYTLIMSDYVMAFWSGDDHEHLERVSAVCELLAREEFGIDSDAEGNLILSRNTKRRLDERISEILAETGRPMHVEELSTVLNNRFPEFTTTPESVRSIVLRYDRFGRYEASSTYGLREWETQDANLKSGTFSDIAEQFLRKASGPQHQFDVADYVLQFRDSTRYSVIGTLKADVSQRFRFFDGGMIGLADKDYAGTDLSFRSLPGRLVETLTRLIKDNGNQVSLSRLIDYCVLHYRMPEQQAQLLFEQSIREEKFELLDNAIVRVPEENRHTT